MQPVLITGTAGFIGFHVAQRLLAAGTPVVGLDNVNPYYPVQLKRDRIAQLEGQPGFEFHEIELADGKAVKELVAATKPSLVIHLAAQAGVRYSLENPATYIESNLTGFGNILEACRHNEVGHLVYASSSSVYGANAKMPFSVHDRVDHPVSLYAATKKANELMAHTYSHLFKLPTTGLRFFTVYGPWGRPDMAYFSFTQRILSGKPIQVFNNGDMKRDFTYIDDIVDGILGAAGHVPQGNPNWDAMNPDPSSSKAPYRVYNIGNNQPVQLLHMIETLERLLGRTAEKEFLPMQPGDVYATYADVDDLRKDVGFEPKTSIEDGLAEFVKWYTAYYGVQIPA